MRTAVLLCVVSACLAAASFPGLRYLGEVGHLRTQSDQRSSVNFGFARAIADEAGDVYFEGRDDPGALWQATIPVLGGVGFTTVWRADFDHNSRQDLMIVAHFPGNGRCIDGTTISFLMMNNRGQPIPWIIQTQMPRSKNDRFPYASAILADINQNGRAEFVATDCEYADPPRFGEDRHITGIFEAQNAMWGLIRPGNLSPYIDLVRHNHLFRAGSDELVPTDPARWADLGNTFDQHRLPPAQIAEILPRSPDCRGVVRLGPVVDGRLLPRQNDPCDELGKNRFRLTDGTTCYGWPTVIFDQPGKREIIAESEDVVPLLWQIVSKRLTAVLAGQREPGRCSPVLLWVTALK